MPVVISLGHSREDFIANLQQAVGPFFFFKRIAGHRLHMDIRAEMPGIELPGIKGQMASTAGGQ